MSFVQPQSSSSARYAFHDARAQIHDLHIEIIANPSRVNAYATATKSRPRSSRMAATMN
ncbi:hypothetical protein X739_18390 [Mesorhizobium sp. LNHC220B00]|nr:hypothetical protein X739_18390 [Mesorhizobium sp. LNHC220B00]